MKKELMNAVIIGVVIGIVAEVVIRILDRNGIINHAAATFDPADKFN